MTRLISSLVVLTAALPIIDGDRIAARAADPPVTVTNTPTNPVPVQEVDNFAKHPFQVGTTSLTNAFNPAGLTLAVVPAGKRLVVEFISATCSPTGAGGTVPGPLAIIISSTTLRSPGTRGALSLTGAGARVLSAYIFSGTDRSGNGTRPVSRKYNEQPSP